MTDEEKERKREWFDHTVTQGFLASLKSDRARLVDMIIDPLSQGAGQVNASFIGGQINAIDAVIQAATAGTK